MTDHIKPFNPELENCAQRWSKWLNRFKLFLTVEEIDDETKQIDNLLYYGGEHVSEAYEAAITGVQKDTTLKAVIDRLDKIFNPEANHTINTFKFRSTKQFEGESFDEFLDRLKALAKSCNFTSGDSELKHQIIFGFIDDKLRARAMEDEKISLENLIKLAKTIIRNLPRDSSSSAVKLFVNTFFFKFATTNLIVLFRD
jgi:hypothetical protein